LTAEQNAEKAKNALQEGGFEEKIMALSLQEQMLIAAKDDIQAAKDAKQKLDECRARYNALRKECVEEDFDGKQAKIEEELSALGEDNTLLDYLKRNFKDVLLAETYGEVRQDLRGLAEKYPVIEKDVSALLEKYTFAKAGDEKSLDVVQINITFKKIEQRKKELNEDSILPLFEKKEDVRTHQKQEPADVPQKEKASAPFSVESTKAGKVISIPLDQFAKYMPNHTEEQITALLIKILDNWFHHMKKMRNDHSR
jgi:hypothetical protein